MVMKFLEAEKVDEKTAERLEKLIEKSYYSYWKKKRIFDVSVTVIILIFLIIPILITALVVFIDDPKGSPFYKQVRIGRHGKPFNMYKFRSMYVDAEKRKKDLMDSNEMDGPVFKMKNDPRITRVGRVLRKYSIDEIPQLFNVLIGNMSIVGPRPALPEEVEKYSDYNKLRLVVTPGITCTWQIMPDKNDIPYEKWLEMDLEYIETRTTLKDIKIILKTPFAMLRANGR
jgi:lipopolysaccharide/colanic/teichoic acid biosynthesis glycosyltransferase